MNLFGVDQCKVYYVNVDDIHVTRSFRKTTVGHKKYKRKKQYYLDTGEFETPVTLKRDNWQLIDGYVTYLLCKHFGQKVPVIFVD